MSKLLGDIRWNTKTAKGAGRFEGALLSLSSGKRVCPWATGGCLSLCLGRSGLSLVYPSVDRARRAKTDFFMHDRKAFMRQLTRELANLVKRSESKGLQAIARMNAYSDIPWEASAFGIPQAFPEVQFWDYSKGIDRALAFANSNALRDRLGGMPKALRKAELSGDLFPRNYHLTYSRNENSLSSNATELLGLGGNIAVAFASQELPSNLLVEGRRVAVIDGTASDFRFEDPKGVIVGLSYRVSADPLTGERFQEPPEDNRFFCRTPEGGELFPDSACWDCGLIETDSVRAHCAHCGSISTEGIAI